MEHPHAGTDERRPRAACAPRLCCAHGPPKTSWRPSPVGSIRSTACSRRTAPASCCRRPSARHPNAPAVSAGFRWTPARPSRLSDRAGGRAPCRRRRRRGRERTSRRRGDRSRLGIPVAAPSRPHPPPARRSPAELRRRIPPDLGRHGQRIRGSAARLAAVGCAAVARASPPRAIGSPRGTGGWMPHPPPPAHSPPGGPRSCGEWPRTPRCGRCTDPTDSARCSTRGSASPARWPRRSHGSWSTLPCGTTPPPWSPRRSTTPPTRGAGGRRIASSRCMSSRRCPAPRIPAPASTFRCRETATRCAARVRPRGHRPGLAGIGRTMGVGSRRPREQPVVRAVRRGQATPRPRTSPTNWRPGRTSVRCASSPTGRACAPTPRPEKHDDDHHRTPRDRRPRLPRARRRRARARPTRGVGARPRRRPRHHPPLGDRSLRPLLGPRRPDARGAPRPVQPTSTD